MRLIDADDTIREIVRNSFSESRAAIEATAKAIHCVENMPSIDAEPQWIPCNEALPAEGEQVLLTNFSQKIDIGHLVKTDEEGYLWEISGSWYNAFNDWEAWMPLPEPYKEDNNG